MSLPSGRPSRGLSTTLALLAAGTLLVGCTSNEPESSGGNADAGSNNATSNNDEPGDTVTIGFSGPAADHGWLAAINSAALEEAEKYEDVELRAAEGTNDASLQISQIETFINDEVDAIVMLPTAGTYACGLVEERGLTNPVIAEIAGIDALPLTQERSKGFADALEDCGQEVDNRVAAEFTVESGEAEASNLLQAAPKIDIIWNHDDDQGVGVKAAFDNAGRDEFAFIGGAGSANAMRWIQDGEMEATVIYPPTQAADGIRLARLIAQDKGLSDLVQVEVPKRIVLTAPVVNADNVEEYLPLGFES
jgi:ribose transport system substrate-binding protein